MPLSVRATRVSLLAGLVALASCSGEDNYAPRETPGKPVMESRPPPLESCKPGKNQVTWVDSPGAPVKGTVERAYHVCLLAHATLLRLQGRSRRRVVMAWLERDLIDVNGHLPTERKRIAFRRPFRHGDTRFLRLRWREDRKRPGQRKLRVRLHSAYFADGSKWHARPWPAIAKKERRPAKPPLRGLQRATKRVRELARRLSAGAAMR